MLDRERARPALALRLVRAFLALRVAERALLLRRFGVADCDDAERWLFFATRRFGAFFLDERRALAEDELALRRALTFLALRPERAELTRDTERLTFFVARFWLFLP